MNRRKEEKTMKVVSLKAKKGITLIALVVTIIVLLILAGVSIAMLTGEGGIINKAKDAAEKYEQAQEDEQKELAEFEKELEDMDINYNDYVGAYVEGYTPTNKGEFKIKSETSGLGVNDKTDSSNNAINVDDNGNQIFKAEEGMKWRIWDYDGTVIRIISDKPTEAKLALKGIAGYNNGVWAINEICRQCYGQYEENGTTMKTGISVSNLKRSDIQKVIKYDYTTYNHSINGPAESGEYEYGKLTQHLASSDKVPEMWIKNDSNWTYNNEDKTGDKEGLIWEKETASSSEIVDTTKGVDIKESLWHYKFYNENKLNEWCKLSSKN